MKIEKKLKNDRLQGIHWGSGKLRALMQQYDQVGKVEETFPFLFGIPLRIRGRRNEDWAAVFFRTGQGNEVEAREKPARR